MQPVQTHELELVNGGGGHGFTLNYINIATVTAAQTNLSGLSALVAQGNSISVSQSN